MIRPFERTLAFRYFRGARGRNERRAFLRFVTVAAIGGVAVGVGALLLAMMIVRGFEREIESKIVGFGQHVQVDSYLGDPLEDAEALATTIGELDGVERVTPVILDFALLRAKPKSVAGEEARPAIEGVLLWGTPSDGQPFVQERTTEGAFDLSEDAEGRAGVVIGARLAEVLGVSAGEGVTIFATRTAAQGGAFGARPKVRSFYVAGIYETGLADFDERFVYADIEQTRSLLGYAPGQASRLDVTLDDIERSPELAETIITTAGPPVFARSVYEVYRGLFAWVDLQKSIVPLVISILVIVAAFNIIGTLLMVVLEKTREIGTVLAMGASRASVRRLFLLLGALVGASGAGLGAGLALLFGWAQDRFAFIPLPQEAYYLDKAPVELQALDFVWITVLAVLLCTLAAYLPARAAARIEPIRTIRFGG
ncbi:MAG: FtsX-like permease family protein [Bacteroidota bacterium]